MAHATRILVIEDEPGIALALYTSLREAGNEVHTAKSGASGMRKLANRKFDIILLDLGLPDMSGLTICRQLREDGLKAPIIILTAESSVRTKVSLFDAGANDYITKPFSLDELQARIRACLRQVPKEKTLPELVVGGLKLNSISRTLEREGLLIPLRRKEFMIMEYLMLHPGAAVSRASLLNYAWDNSDEGWTNTVDVHIKHLRDKVDRPFEHTLIKTVHGIGYKLEISNPVANNTVKGGAL